MTQKFTAEEVRAAGAMLANCAFNLAQCDRLTERERRSLDESRRAWDAAIAAQPVAADTLSKPTDSGLISAASNVLAADDWWKCNSDSPKSALNHYEEACADLRSALHYRDEQEKQA